MGRDYGTSKNYSEKTASEIDDEIRRIIDTAFSRAEKILSEHMDKLTFVAEYLISHETMDDSQFEKIMTNDSVTVEELEALVAEKKRKSEEENRLREQFLAAQREKRREEERRETPPPFIRKDDDAGAETPERKDD